MELEENNTKTERLNNLYSISYLSVCTCQGRSAKNESRTDFTRGDKKYAEK